MSSVVKAAILVPCQDLAALSRSAPIQQMTRDQYRNTRLLSITLCDNEDTGESLEIEFKAGDDHIVRAP